MAKADTFKKNRAKAQSDYIAEKVDPLLVKKKPGFFTGTDITNFNYAISGTPLRGSNYAQNIPDSQMQPVPITQPMRGELQQGLQQELPVIDRQDGRFMTYDAESKQGSSREFIASFTNRGPRGVQSLPDGGTLYEDGVIRYQDGTERLGNPEAQGVQTLLDGSIRYSDGSIKKPAARAVMGFDDGTVLYDDGTVRRGVQNISNFPELTSSILGGDYPVTQEYGNINPGMGYVNDINRGTDIGVSNSPLVLPFNATVVGITKDDGTRWGDYSGHQGYGNSILVRLETGEMFRFAHLDNMQIPEDGIIRAGQTFGITGATGNVTGPHLDLEYYNAQGQLDNPNNFTGFTTPDAISGAITANTHEVVPEQELTPDKLNLVRQAKAQSAEPVNEPRYTPIPQQSSEQYAPAADLTAGQMVARDIESQTAKAEQYGQRVDAPNLYIGEAGRLINDVAQGEASKQEVGRRLGRGLDELGQRLDAPQFNAGELLSGQISPKDFLGSVLKKAGAKELGASIQQADDLADLTRDYGTRKGIPEINASEFIQSSKPSEMAGIAKDKLGDIATAGKGLLDKTVGGFRNAVDNSFTNNTLPRGAFAQDNLAIGDSPAGQPITTSQGTQTNNLNNENNQLAPSDQEVLGVSTQRQEVPTEKETFQEDPYRGVFDPSRKLSPLESRLQEMGSRGRDVSNDSKFAKLYKRFKSLKEKYGSVPSSATRTGYASPEADSRAQEVRVQKEEFYSGKYGDTGGSYDKFMSSGGPATFTKQALKTSTRNDLPASKLQNASLPQSYEKDIQSSLGIQDGSAVLTTKNIGKQERLSTPEEIQRAGTTFKKKQVGSGKIDAYGNIVFYN